MFFFHSFLCHADRMGTDHWQGLRLHSDFDKPQPTYFVLFFIRSLLSFQLKSFVITGSHTWQVLNSNHQHPKPAISSTLLFTALRKWVCLGLFWFPTLFLQWNDTHKLSWLLCSIAHNAWILSLLLKPIQQMSPGKNCYKLSVHFAKILPSL